MSTELYEFTDSTDAVPPPPDLGVTTEPAPQEEPAQAPAAQPVDIYSLDLMIASQFTIVIRLLPLVKDQAERFCTLGVQLDKQAPSISVMPASELGVLPDPIWHLMQAQAQLAAAKPATPEKKKAEVPPPLTTRAAKPAPATKTAPATTKPVPAAVAPQDDIYSLFDL